MDKIGYAAPYTGNDRNPDPRTLAMTLWGDLDVSVIDELPPGRKPIQTIHWGENSRPRLHEFMKRDQIRTSGLRGLSSD